MSINSKVLDISEIEAANCHFRHRRRGLQHSQQHDQCRAAGRRIRRRQHGKAAESQRLFGPRRETVFAQDCVVELAGPPPGRGYRTMQ
jgi:hypothetical protein